ncbi:DNA damage-inducible transcript 4-like protein [Mastacembelus armatus]|uniref:Uncharacterized LOC113144464 n=1 Tax=Mastacembelus armatus TaxID=205130 RepID=A0A3Q3MK62_9TELE|nr:DNA damage-inducible transcript 4-like protein [Mastacembelus armatus]
MVYTAALVFGHGAFTEEESVVGMIGKYFSQLCSRPPGSKTGSARRGSVESCDESENSSPFANLDSGLEDEGRLLQQDVTRHLELCLTEAKASTLHCQVLLLPRQMTGKIGQDIVSSSILEPCGLRGASIQVYVESEEYLKSVGSIFPDPSVTPTFELSVILKAEKDSWPPLKHIFDNNKVLKLRPEYRLVKRKLYSSASPVIHDSS